MLPFRIDYINTIKVGVDVKDKKVPAIDTERALLDSRRIAEVVGYTLEHFDQKTRRTFGYVYTLISNVSDVAAGRNRVEEVKVASRVKGFNALFAVASIEAAKRYYTEFAKQQQMLPPNRRLKVGLIYSYAPNDAEEDGFLDEEAFETDALDKSSRDFLEAAISDYNAIFGTNYDTSSDKFQNYYKDLSLRLKNRQIDLVIVCNMFLTGFDATTLNTLFVGKRLASEPRADPGLLAHQPDPELGQDLRQHRHLPRSGEGDQRRHRSVRQQGCEGHRAAEAVRRLLRRVW